MTFSNMQVTTLGLAHNRYRNQPFGIHLRDRMQGLYLIGQTGVGKSTLLLNMARQDARRGQGFCLIDPHGDLAGALAAELPSSAIVWNVADATAPYGYNPLTAVSTPLQLLVVSGLIETLKAQWGDSWGVRMEHILRHILLALMSHGHADLRDVMRLVLDKEFRNQALEHCHDPQVRQFWRREFPAMNYKTAFDGVAPIANKLGAFLSHPVVRRAVCNPQTPLRLRKIMDDGQILIINLAKGRLGADMANVMGGLLVSGLSNAAFSRQDMPEHLRKPYALIIDEFHNFTSETLTTALSENRKHGLALTLAQQHCQQSYAAVMASIWGNVGSLISFRIGAEDAPRVARQLGRVTPEQLVNQPNYQAMVRLMVDGAQTHPFTATTLPPDFGTGGF